MGHAGLRAISSQAWAAGRAVCRSDGVHSPPGHGRFFCFGGIAGTAGAARKTRGRRWAAGSARRGFRRELRSAVIRHSLGYAFATSEPPLSALDFFGWAPRAIFGVERPRRYHPREILSDRGNGFD